MKAILSLWGHRYVRTAGSLLIAVVLIAAVVSCTPTPPPEEYTLTMAADPVAGGTAIDETGTSPYPKDEVVDIKAVPAPCYRFVNWTAPAGTFGDPNAASTNFTMPARNVTVTAHFEVTPPDHFKFYTVNWETAPYVGMDVKLVDQFGTFNVKVGPAVSFGNPVQKIHNDDTFPIEDPLRHYTIYALDYGEGPWLDSWQVMVSNQFQPDTELTVQGPVALAVPTTKEDHGDPTCTNHYLLYGVIDQSTEPVDVELMDQFMDETVTVYQPVLFGNPVQKTVGSEVTEIEKEEEHWVAYYIEGEPFDPRTVQIQNQFHTAGVLLDLVEQDVLAVPSQKLSVGQVLDHFNCYWTEPIPPGEWVVQLEDQFHDGAPIIATVGPAYLFANPANKWHGESFTPLSDWDDHYTLYMISYDGFWEVFEVTVSNQFDPGAAPQQVYVEGPKWLAVPTRKGDQDPPDILDHMLVYQVVGVEVWPAAADFYLDDQWVGQWESLYEPYLFANPVTKTVPPGGAPIPIMYPDRHLMFYYISGGDYYEPLVQIENQFGPQVLPVWESELDLIGVPSAKLGWSKVTP